MKIYDVKVTEDGTDEGCSIYLFDDIHEAEQFRNHLRDLYGLDVNIETSEIDTYDSAIASYVEFWGPSPDDDTLDPDDPSSVAFGSVGNSDD